MSITAWMRPHKRLSNDEPLKKFTEEYGFLGITRLPYSDEEKNKQFYISSYELHYFLRGSLFVMISTIFIVISSFAPELSRLYFGYVFTSRFVLTFVLEFSMWMLWLNYRIYIEINRKDKYDWGGNTIALFIVSCFLWYLCISDLERFWKGHKIGGDINLINSIEMLIFVSVAFWSTGLFLLFFGPRLRLVVQNSSSEKRGD